MAEKFTPHGVSGVRFAPSYHRPFLRYVDSVDGAEGANGAEGQDNTDWKAEARKWEDRAKANRKEADDNKGAAQRLADLENASKSEADKTADRITSLEKQLAEASRSALVARIQALTRKRLRSRPHGWQLARRSRRSKATSPDVRVTRRTRTKENRSRSGANRCALSLVLRTTN